MITRLTMIASSIRSRFSVSIDSWISPDAVVAGDDLDARGQGLLQLRELPLDAVDHVERVLPVAHHDDAADRLALAVPFRHAFAQVGSETHHAQIADQHRRAVVGRDRDLLEIGERMDVAQAADHVVGARHLEHAPADFAVAVANLVDHGFAAGPCSASSRFGSSFTWYCLTKPPMVATSATPGTVSSA